MRKPSTLCSYHSSSHPRKTRRKAMVAKSDRYGESPSEYIVRNILNYSRALAVLKPEDSGLFRMLMN
jgi:hypothetical protein